MKTLTAALTTEKNKLDMASAWLPLVTVEVSASEILRVVPNPTNVTFRGETYVAFGVEIDEAVTDAKGGLHDLNVSVSNVTREISAYIEFHELRGARVTILYVNSAHLSDLDAVVAEERYEIMSIQVKGSQFVTFTLGHDRINQHPFPSGRFFRDNCRWMYKKVECGYGWIDLDTDTPTFIDAPLATCDKILEGANGCRAHANAPRFGSFPLLTPIPGRIL